MSPEAKYLYLTTIGRRSRRPRQIEIWFTRRDGRYYLVAEHGLKAHWVRNLLAEPTVRARVGRRSFRGRARVVDAQERELVAAIRTRSEAKYGWGAGLVVEIAPAGSREAPCRPRARRSSASPPPGSARRRTGAAPPRR